MGYLTSPRLQAERESQEKYRNTQSERGKVSAQKRQEQTAIKKPTRDKLSRPAKKSTELSKIKTPDYQNPDTQGNPREQLRGTRNIWLSAPEFERLKIRFNELNFTREQKEIAIAKVDTWFSENPKKLATSSSHITRILDWGIKTALELSTAESRAEKARAPQQQFLSAEEKRQRTNKETYEQLLRIETTAGDTGGYDEITNDSFLIALTSDRD
jgi:hypothetical protein